VLHGRIARWRVAAYFVVFWCWVAGGVVNLIVEDGDALHAEFVGKGVRIDTGPVDQTWGTREMYVKDADGNSIRFIRPNSG